MSAPPPDARDRRARASTSARGGRAGGRGAHARPAGRPARASARLPLRQREVLALRELEGLSHAAICEILELRPNAVAQLAWRARAGLCTALRLGALASIAPAGAECERALTLLGLLEDGPLPEAADDAWVSAHLDGCSRCCASRAAMAEAGATYRLWGPIAAAAALRSGLLHRAGEGSGVHAAGAAGPSGGGSPSGQSVPPVAVAVIAALCLAGGAWGLGLVPGGGAAHTVAVAQATPAVPSAAGASPAHGRAAPGLPARHAHPAPAPAVHAAAVHRAPPAPPRRAPAHVHRTPVAPRAPQAPGATSAPSLSAPVAPRRRLRLPGRPSPGTFFPSSPRRSPRPCPRLHLHGDHRQPGPGPGRRRRRLPGQRVPGRRRGPWRSVALRHRPRRPRPPVAPPDAILARLRVLVVLAKTPLPEGDAAGRCAVAVLRGLASRGADVRAVAAERFPRRAVPPPPDLPVEVINMPLVPSWGARARRITDPRGQLGHGAFAARVRELAAQADVVHLDELDTAAAGVGLAVPSVLHVHNLWRRDRPLAPLWSPTGREYVEQRLAERRAWRRARSLLANSPEVAAELRDRAPRAHVETVPLGLDPAAYGARATLDDPVAGLIGSAAWAPTERAVRRLLERVWPLVLALHPGARLRLAGRGMERERFADLPDQPGVEWVGGVASATAFLESLGVLLYPPREGSGTKVKVLEAMAVGLPVVTTQAGAEGLVSDGGVRVREGDDELAAATAELLGDPAARRALGEAGHAAFTRHHTPGAVADALLGAYGRVLAAG